MTLTEARKLFNKLRRIGAYEIDPHAAEGHLDQRFTTPELIRIILGSGVLKDTDRAENMGKHFFWHFKDLDNNNGRLGLEFVTYQGKKFIVFHSWRDTK